MTVELIELVSRDEANCGRVWPWSKKRYLWQLRLDGQLTAVEVQCSWRSEKCRVSVNGAVVRYGSLVGLKEYDFEFFQRDIPLAVKIAGHSADLMVDGLPAEYFSQTMRTQQESIFLSVTTAQSPEQTAMTPRPSNNLNTNYTTFVDDVSETTLPVSAKKPLLY